MLHKSHIFYLILIFTAGFLIWNVSASFGKNIINRVLGEASQIGSEFFTASVNPDYKIPNRVPDRQNSDDGQDLKPQIAVNYSAVKIRGPIVLTQDDVRDKLDDIQEKLDIIAAKIRHLQEQQNQYTQEQNKKQEDDMKIDLQEDELDGNSKDKKKRSDAMAAYPKILISEIQIYPVNARFIELYNPNPADVDLTGWYVQRKTQGDDSWGSFLPAANLQNKKIFAGGYFLISREISNSDILSDITFSPDNSLALKNPSGEVSDKLGFGNASDSESYPAQNPAENQSIGRKNPGQDTDNNSADFELDSPTPKSQNFRFTPVALSGGGVAYAKVLISEVEMYPIKERFIELYNPSSADVNLTDWYLQRKDGNDDSWGSLVSSANFQDKIIRAGGYFLISREISNSDILSDITLSPDNSLALKNPNGIISDKVGFGSAKDFEGVQANNITDGNSSGRKWSLSDNFEQDTDNNYEDFELEVPTPKSSNVAYSAPDQIDITAPQISFSIDAIQSQLAFPVNFTVSYPILGTASPSGVGSYVFRWQADGSADWQTDNPVKVDGSPAAGNFARNFSGEDGKTYHFQIQATDSAGNISGWLPAIPASAKVNVPKKILISELQISPIAQRFVELYNPNSADIDLAGWYLQRKDSNDASWSSFVSASNFQNKTITAGGYFLISREIAGSDILSDITLSPDNSLALKNPAGEIVDKLGYGSAIDPEISPAENPPNSRSIGRKNLEQDTGNNSADFEIENPTPKAGNIALTVPPSSNLASIKIATPATKLVYNVGDPLDIAGLAITGIYSDGSTAPETIASADITGFDSAVANPSEVLTITINGIFTSYNISIVAVPPPSSGAVQLKIISSPQAILAGSPSAVFTVESQNSASAKENVSASVIVILSSSSPTGMFSSKSSSSCGTDWTKTSITISKGDAHKSFCYKDETPGNPTITVSSSGFSSDSQAIAITPPN